MQDIPPAHLKIYLLRLWQDEPHHPWQITIKSSTSDKRYVFQNLKELQDFLQKQMDGIDER
ncbi:MAG: hypothetical protein Kow0031_05700 [Anaerolineae bacterium]